MFLSKDELYTAIQEYQLEDILGCELDAAVHSSILAAVQEATSYLNSQYDCQAIFSAKGDERNILVVEHCKSIALWYLVKRANTDMLFERVKEYYASAKEWLKLVAGTDPGGRPLAPDLPLKTQNGEVVTKVRYGSNRKFDHDGYR